ncbi:hypothetical protein BGZ76_011392 [Entomortierella beljakovae]|nr:hypothetical protein BGZ76_011392 [Entomortierella beljakovae]
MFTSLDQGNYNEPTSSQQTGKEGSALDIIPNLTIIVRGNKQGMQKKKQKNLASSISGIVNPTTTSAQLSLADSKGKAPAGSAEFVSDSSPLFDFPPTRQASKVQDSQPTSTLRMKTQMENSNNQRGLPSIQPPSARKEAKISKGARKRLKKAQNALINAFPSTSSINPIVVQPNLPPNVPLEAKSKKSTSPTFLKGTQMQPTLKPQTTSNLQTTSKLQTALKQQLTLIPVQAAPASTSTCKGTDITYVSIGGETPLVPALFGSTPVISGNKISRRSAGECIVRATFLILNRNSSFMSKDLFMQCYRQSFGCLDLDGKPYSHDCGFLDSKLISSLIEVRPLNGIKYYRITPGYFHQPTDAQTTPLTSLPKPTYYSGHNASDLPPVQPIEPRILSKLLSDFDTRFITIATTFPHLCPSHIREASPLSEFASYLPIWYPDLNPSAPKLAKLLEESKLNPISVATLSNLSVIDVSQENFGQILEFGKGTGMASKKARNLLSKHSIRSLGPQEAERVKTRRSLLVERSISADYPSLVATYSSSAGDTSPPTIKTEQPKSEFPRSEFESVWHPIKRESTPEGMDLDKDIPVDQSTLRNIFAPKLPPESAKITSNITENINATSELGNHGVSKSSHSIPNITQRHQLRAAIQQERLKPYELKETMKEERFKPYPSLIETGDNPAKPSRKRRRHARTGGDLAKTVESSSQNKDTILQTYIPKGGIYTLPRPILPRRMGIPDENSSVPSHLDSANLSVNMNGLNLGYQDHLLQPSRDQVIKERRQALEKIIEHVWSLPMRLT